MGVNTSIKLETLPYFVVATPKAANMFTPNAYNSLWDSCVALPDMFSIYMLESSAENTANSFADTESPG